MAGDGMREAAVEMMARPIKHICKIVGADERKLAAEQLAVLLALLDERGFVVVPKVATEEQRAAMRRLNHPRDHEIYEAALAASPNPFAEEPPHG